MPREYGFCGLGNGLVDIQFEITDSELIELGLAKGEMRLVDVDQQAELWAKFADKEMHLCSGGSAANTAIAFSKLGGKAAYKTVLGRDENGVFYANEFTELGIMLKAEFIETAPTGSCFVFITPDSERTMYTALGATACFDKTHIDEELIANSEWLYIEGYKFSQDAATEAVCIAHQSAKRSGTKVAVTFSDLFITEYFRDNLAKVAENCDLIFCNEAEAKSYTKSETVDEAYDKLCAICPNVVVTMGPAGSKVRWEGKNYLIPSYPATPVDTTGAGDMYAGCFLYGITAAGDPEAACKLASYASALVVSQFGARLNSDLAEIKKEFLPNIL
ncbi:MAG: adenosine kinase [Chloroflexota bacterium]